MSMTKKTAFRVFAIGTVSSSILFLWLTVDTHRQVAALSHADKLSPEVVEGKRVFEKYNCNDCHTILGFGGYYAPDLTKVVQRIGVEGLTYRIKSPEKAFQNSVRKMPHQNLSDSEIGKLAEFFAWVGNIDNGDWPPQDSKKHLTRNERMMVATVGLSPGAAVFKSKGCMNCHSIHGEGGSFGPALDTVGQKMSKEAIAHYIRDPRSVNAQSMMPPQSTLNDREIDDVSEFLMELNEEGSGEI